MDMKTAPLKNWLLTQKKKNPLLHSPEFPNPSPSQNLELSSFFQKHTSFNICSFMQIVSRLVTALQLVLRPDVTYHFC